MSVDQLREEIRKKRDEGLSIVHCHGTFDLLHPGHIKHFEEASRFGDVLVVTVTAAAYVNKGPDRPCFNDEMRCFSLASLSMIDFVCLIHAKDAINIIGEIQPDYYVKGEEYKDYSSDVTQKIRPEADAVAACGGCIKFTSGQTFSSSKLINKHFSGFSENTKDYLNTLRSQMSSESVLAALDEVKDLRVLVVGDPIVDQYQYVDPLGMTGKGVHLVAKSISEESYLGGCFAIARQIRELGAQVQLLSVFNDQDPEYQQMSGQLHGIHIRTIPVSQNILRKKRFVLKDKDLISKLFETYSCGYEELEPEQTNELMDALSDLAKDVDLILVCDFGNGMINQTIRNHLSGLEPFLAINAQVNSGNRGYNVVTHYSRADYICMNEPELRLTCRSKTASVEDMGWSTLENLRAKFLSCTKGTKGVSFFEKGVGESMVPALSQKVVDRVGAGDAYFGTSAVCLAKGISPVMAPFLGSLAASLNVQVVANKEAFTLGDLKKYIMAIMK